MLTGSLETKDGSTYGFEMDTGLLPHFYVDCRCGGKSGAYAGPFLEDQTGEFRVFQESHADDTDPGGNFSHTFVYDDKALTDELRARHTEEEGQRPMRIVCTDCEARHEFILESYRTLKAQMKHRNAA